MLSKKEQTKSNRLKPKYSSKNKKKITSEDKTYLQYLQCLDEKCIVCGSYSIEWHHVKKNSVDKKDHTKLIPLCPMHHRLSNDFSAHGTPKKFKEKYPIEAQNQIAEKFYNDFINNNIMQ